MAVDLGDFIASLQAEVSPPGTNDFPTATDDEWLAQLQNAFWSARLDGLLARWTCDENGIITPLVVTEPDIGRDMIQLVVLYGSFAVLRNALRGLRTMFSATAGPVKFEYQQSANLLVALMKDLITRRDIILARLSDLGSANSYVIDAIIARDESLIYGNTYWVNSGDPHPGSLYGLNG